MQCRQVNVEWNLVTSLFPYLRLRREIYERNATSIQERRQLAVASLSAGSVHSLSSVTDRCRRHSQDNFIYREDCSLDKPFLLPPFLFIAETRSSGTGRTANVQGVICDALPGMPLGAQGYIGVHRTRYII